ncbi:MAG: hypothetical protein Kow0062_25960 [Acidobacteriota bacterium]
MRSLQGRGFRAVAALLLAVLAASAAVAASKNGFDLDGALIPADEIRSGGPPRDGIPALTDPPRVAAAQAGWLRDDDRVIGVALGDEAVAYPVRILNWHEIVNDVVGGRPVAVTYCPLCRTGVVFDAMLDGQRRLFGVSGLLYNSDVLLYDRATDSLVSQLEFRAVSGPLRGRRLELVPATVTTWGAWRARHPDTLVLARETGFRRDYDRDPYTRYHAAPGTMFPVRGAEGSRPAKEWAWLVRDGDRTWILSERHLRRAARRGGGRLRLGRLLLAFERDTRSLSATRPDGTPVAVVPGYWFALTAFHRDALRDPPLARRGP